MNDSMSSSTLSMDSGQFFSRMLVLCKHILLPHFYPDATLHTSWIKTNLELPLPTTPQKLFTVTNDFLTVNAKNMFQTLPQFKSLHQLTLLPMPSSRLCSPAASHHFTLLALILFFFFALILLGSSFFVLFPTLLIVTQISSSSHLFSFPSTLDILNLTVL